MDMADLPPQTALAPASEAEARARYFNSGNAFNNQAAAGPRGVFTEPARQALSADTPTGFIACDQSAAMGCAFPATSPLMLARYASSGGEHLVADFEATGSIWYVIEGKGRAVQGGETIAFAKGDVFLLTRAPAALEAATRTVLWVVTNEPQLAFDADRRPTEEARPVDPVHYPAPRSPGRSRSSMRGAKRPDLRHGADLLLRPPAGGAQHPADAHAVAEHPAAQDAPESAPATIRRRSPSC